MSPQESVILCEGYHDRAFWDGWLRHLGCAIPEDPSKPLTTKVVKDPWGIRVAGGQFGYHSPTRQFVRLTPCGGDDKVHTELRNRLQGRATKSLRRLVVSYDADADARSEPDAGPRIQSIHDSVRSLLKEVDTGFTKSATGDYLLDGGSTVVSVMAGWYAEKGCEAFYSDLWKEPAVARQLESRLTQLGAWRIAQEVAA